MSVFKTFTRMSSATAKTKVTKVNSNDSMLWLYLTSEALQRVITSLLVTDKEAIAVEEVGPGHLYLVKSATASSAHGFTRAAARLQHLLLLTAWGQHRAAQHANLRVTLSAQQRFSHADEEVLSASFSILTSLVTEDVWEHGLSVGHVIAVGQH